MRTITNNRLKNNRLDELRNEFRKSLDENPTETIKKILESLLDYQFLLEKHKKYVDSLPTYEEMKQEFRKIRTEFFERQSNGKLSDKEIQELEEWKEKNRLDFHRNFIKSLQETKSK